MRPSSIDRYDATLSVRFDSCRNLDTSRRQRTRRPRVDAVDGEMRQVWGTCTPGRFSVDTALSIKMGPCLGSSSQVSAVTEL